MTRERIRLLAGKSSAAKWTKTPSDYKNYWKALQVGRERAQSKTAPWAEKCGDQPMGELHVDKPCLSFLKDLRAKPEDR
jgi:hypothetical protein